MNRGTVFISCGTHRHFKTVVFKNIVSKPKREKGYKRAPKDKRNNHAGFTTVPTLIYFNLVEVQQGRQSSSFK